MVNADAPPIRDSAGSTSACCGVNLSLTQNMVDCCLVLMFPCRPRPVASQEIASRNSIITARRPALSPQAPRLRQDITPLQEGASRIGADFLSGISVTDLGCLVLHLKRGAFFLLEIFN